MENWHFVSYEVMGGTAVASAATVALKKGDHEIRETSIGNGPIDAIFKCIDRIAGHSGQFLGKKVEILKQGLFTVLLSVKLNSDTFPGRGTSPDMLEASARAYVDAHNRNLARVNRAKVEQCFLMQAESI
ncbi:MAG: alpha-isopropylmalate synthase regulatory domain-containing protein [bacterium]